MESQIVGVVPMHRFYLPPEQCADEGFFLAGREAHHAARVMRVRRGERIAVLDGAGHEFLCDVQDVGRDKVKLAVREKRFIPQAPCRLTLLQAVPKGKLMEAIIQKATELGVYRIVPLLSERVVAQLDEDEAAGKAEKWQLTAIEAIKQCGASWLPRVESPLRPKDFLERQMKFELSLVASLQSDSQHPRKYFQSFCSCRGRLPESVCVWVGPEGDFTLAELDAIKAGGALPITLGRLVLRSETAAVYCLSILNYELQSPSR